MCANALRDHELLKSSARLTKTSSAANATLGRKHMLHAALNAELGAVLSPHPNNGHHHAMASALHLDLNVR